MESPDRRPLHVEFKPLEEDRLEAVKEDFPNYLDGLVRGTPGDFVFTPAYAERAEDIYNFQVRPDDYWVVTFPKCGTTWTQELVWLVGNDGNFEEAKKVNLHQRTDFLEMSFIPPKNFMDRFVAKDVGETKTSHPEDGAPQHDAAKPFKSLEQIEALPSPRFIKSHLPLYLLPPDLLDKAKVVYVARNPKDVIVSYFFHHKLIKINQFDKGLEEFAEYFMKDELLYSPYFPHILEAWRQRHHPNLLFIFYEDMKSDLAGQVRKIADFFGKPMSEDTIEKMVDHLKIDNFAKNDSVNNEFGKKTGIFNPDGRFVRKGKTGDWKNHFNAEMNARIDQWIEKNLADTDLKFVSELEHQD